MQIFVSRGECCRKGTVDGAYLQTPTLRTRQMYCYRIQRWSDGGGDKMLWGNPDTQVETS